MAVLIMAQGDYHSKDLPGYQPQLKKPTSPPFLCEGFPEQILYFCAGGANIFLEFSGIH